MISATGEASSYCIFGMLTVMLVVGIDDARKISKKL